MFRSLIRQLPVYALVVWSRYHLGHVHQLQSVQRRFIRHPSCRVGFDFIDVPVEEVSAAYSLQSLECRRRLVDLTFFFRLLSGQINCPCLLESISFRTPTSTRHERLYELPHAGSNHHSALLTLMRLGKDIRFSVDFFGTSLRAVKCSALLPPPLCPSHEYCADSGSNPDTHPLNFAIYLRRKTTRAGLCLHRLGTRPKYMNKFCSLIANTKIISNVIIKGA